MIITEENKHKYRQVNRIVETYPNGMIKRSESINKYKENDEPALPAPYIIAPIPKDFVYPAEVESFYLEKLEATDKQVILPDGTPALKQRDLYFVASTLENRRKITAKTGRYAFNAGLVYVLPVDVGLIFGGVA